MAKPGPREITRLKIVSTYFVEVKFKLSGPAAILNSIEYTESGTGWASALIMNVAGSVNIVVVQIPASGFGKQWAFRVRGTNGDGIGPYGDIERINVPGFPGTPAPPTLNLTRPRSITVSWSAANANGSPIIEYQVQYYDSTNNGAPKYILTPNRSVVVTDAVLGTTSGFRVRARNAVGWGEWSYAALMLLDGGPRLRVSGTFRHTIAYVKHNGSWKKAIPYVKHNGAWKPGTG